MNKIPSLKLGHHKKSPKLPDISFCRVPVRYSLGAELGVGLTGGTVVVTTGHVEQHPRTSTLSLVPGMNFTSRSCNFLTFNILSNGKKTSSEVTENVSTSSFAGDRYGMNLGLEFFLL